MEQTITTSGQLRYPSALGAVLAGIGVVIGSMGPWVKATLPFVGTITVSGTDGNNDGIITLIVGIAAVVAMVVVGFVDVSDASRRILTALAMLGFLAVAFVAFVDWGNVRDNLREVDEEYQGLVSVGWGLYLTGLAAGVGFVMSLLQLQALQPNANDEIWSGHEM